MESGLEEDESSEGSVIKLRKIISGGQTGADQAGLFAAEDLGLETGGWMPLGCRTQAGPRPDLRLRFKMKESASAAYPPRTRFNVVESDGTIIFGNSHSPGCALTIRICAELRRPFIVNPLVGEFMVWLDTHNIEVLNVAGNREETNPGIFNTTREFLVNSLRVLRRSALPEEENGESV